MLILLRWLHLLAAITWLGGMIFLSLVLHPVLRRELKGEAYLLVVRRLARRFRVLGWLALGVLLATGVFLIGTRSAALGSQPYAWTLSVKLALVLAILALNYLHNLVWGPRLYRLVEAGNPGAEMSPLLRRVRWGGRAELLLGLGIVLCAVILSHL